MMFTVTLRPEIHKPEKLTWKERAENQDLKRERERFRLCVSVYH